MVSTCAGGGVCVCTLHSHGQYMCWGGCTWPWSVHVQGLCVCTLHSHGQYMCWVCVCVYIAMISIHVLGVCVYIAMISTCAGMCVRT